MQVFWLNVFKGKPIVLFTNTILVEPLDYQRIKQRPPRHAHREMQIYALLHIGVY